MRAQFVRHSNSKRGLGIGHYNKEVLARSLGEDLESHGIVFQQYPKYNKDRNRIEFETESVPYVKHYTDKFLRNLGYKETSEMNSFGSWNRDATFIIDFNNES